MIRWEGVVAIGLPLLLSAMVVWRLHTARRLRWRFAALLAALSGFVGMSVTLLVNGVAPPVSFVAGVLAAGYGFALFSFIWLIGRGIRKRGIKW